MCLPIKILALGTFIFVHVVREHVHVEIFLNNYRL